MASRKLSGTQKRKQKEQRANNAAQLSCTMKNWFTQPVSSTAAASRPDVSVSAELSDHAETLLENEKEDNFTDNLLLASDNISEDRDNMNDNTVETTEKLENITSTNTTDNYSDSESELSYS